MQAAACKPPCMAFSATPGSPSRPARSPMTNTSRWPGTERSASTEIRPDRWVCAPSASAAWRANGTASTPAVHSTVRTAWSVLGLPSLGVTVIPSRRTSVTCTPKCRSTPRSSSTRCALSVSAGAKLFSTRSPPSNSSTRASPGEMLWNSLANARVANSRICPASSTPVGPPPATAKVSHSSRSGPGGSVSAISKAANTRRRMLSASSRVFMPGAHVANCSLPK